MSINRKAYQNLIKWKNSETRKPLLLRGARQVGKTTLVRQFAKEFDAYVELNLERESDKNLFTSDRVNDILNGAYLLKSIVPNGKILFFIDEIQELPKAIQMLRYFYEEKPEIYVVAAGSLLEFALKDVPNFPVGRIEYLYLSPINFEEYLGALKNDPALEVLKIIPFPEYAHQILIKLFHEYAIIGGMPEIVNQYIKDQNIINLGKTYNALWQSYKEDVEKYAQNNTYKNVIRHLIETAPFETDRIKFEGFGKSNYKSREVGEAFRALDLAKVIQIIYPSTSMEPPIVPDIKKRPRLQFLDTGMINQVLMLQGQMITLNDLDDFYKGKIIQHLVTQELISIFKEVPYKPNFWVREEGQSNAEVDLIFRHEKYIIPIEIKSGKTGTLRSLHQFMERSNHPYAVRIYSGKFNVEQAKTISGKSYYLMNLPYFLSYKIPEYLDWFVNNYE